MTSEAWVCVSLSASSSSSSAVKVFLNEFTISLVILPKTSDTVVLKKDKYGGIFYLETISLGVPVYIRSQSCISLIATSEAT